MDGLLLDTEDLYSLCINLILEKYQRPKLPWSMKAKLQGRPGPVATKLFHEWAQLPITLEEYVRQYYSLQAQHFPGTQPMPGIPKLLGDLNRTRYWEVKRLQQQNQQHMMATRTAVAKPTVHDKENIDPIHRKTSNGATNGLGLSNGTYQNGNAHGGINGTYQNGNAHGGITNGSVNGASPRRHFRANGTTIMAAKNAIVAAAASLPSRVHIALATSSHESNFRLKTSHLTDLFSVFPTQRRVLGDDKRIAPGRGKPLPDIYLVALKTINDSLPAGERPILPEECLVFEDSVPGVEAGRRAGMRVVWCLHPMLKKEYAGREAEVLAGRTGEAGQVDMHQLGEMGDGWAELYETLVDFPYEKYGVVVPPHEVENEVIIREGQQDVVRDTVQVVEGVM
jgi:beta-phosphoglucomutase-like phosphatase (HAD superfamily)